MNAYEALKELEIKLSKQHQRLLKMVGKNKPMDKYAEGIEDGLICALREINSMIVDLELARDRPTL